MQDDPPAPQRRSAWRRWALFGAALVSLLLMTYAGVLLAFSVALTPEMLDANRDVPEAGRAIVVPVTDPSLVRTHELHGEGAFLVVGSDGSFPAAATRVGMARALAYVEPAEGQYDPPTLSLVDVASRNGTSNLTVDVASVAGGEAGWIVMGSGEDAPRFYGREDVLGEATRFVSGAGLALTFAFGFVGFLAPLIALVVTHRPSGQRGAPQLACRECGAPLPRNADFCLRCGAYRGGE